jgi:hypothetical protein
MDTSAHLISVSGDGGKAAGAVASSSATALESRSEDRNKALEFQIDKCHASMIESGKKAEHAFLAYLVVMSVGALLIFGTGLGLEQRVAIPLLQVAMNKSYAAFGALIVSPFILYAFWTSIQMHAYLSQKLHTLFEDRYPGEQIPLWHLRYPSVVVVSVALAASHRKLGKPFSYLFIWLVLGTIIAPCGLAWRLGSSLNLGEAATTVVVVAMFALSAGSAVTILAAPDGPGERAIAALDAGETADLSERDNHILATMFAATMLGATYLFSDDRGVRIAGWIVFIVALIVVARRERDPRLARHGRALRSKAELRTVTEEGTPTESNAA